MSSTAIEQTQTTTFAVEIAVGGLLFDMDGVLGSSTFGEGFQRTTQYELYLG